MEERFFNEMKQPREDKLFKMAILSDATVLLRGPTGSGKTTLARRIHEQSRRGAKPFVTVNLSALHEGVLESELFGHERGSFTGADQRRVGLLESANGGTVFLDEIGELPLKLQARLLDFFQSKRVTPVGGNKVLQLDVRLILATHRNLEAMVGDGTFREDLYHRINLLEMPLPSLAEQAEDFMEIFENVVTEFSRTENKSILRVDSEVADMIETYLWPGNFRELRNMVHFSVLSSSDGVLRFEDLPGWFVDRWRQSVNESSSSSKESKKMDQPNLVHAALKEIRVQSERQVVMTAFHRYRTIREVAVAVGVSESTLKRRLKTWGLTKKIRQKNK